MLWLGYRLSPPKLMLSLTPQCREVGPNGKYLSYRGRSFINGLMPFSLWQDLISSHRNKWLRWKQVVIKPGHTSGFTSSRVSAFFLTFAVSWGSTEALTRSLVDAGTMPLELPSLWNCELNIPLFFTNYLVSIFCSSNKKLRQIAINSMNILKASRARPWLLN